MSSQGKGTIRLAVLFLCNLFFNYLISLSHLWRLSTLYQTTFTCKLYRLGASKNTNNKTRKGTYSTFYHDVYYWTR